MEEQAASMLAASDSHKTRYVMEKSSQSEKVTDEVVLYYGLISYATRPPDGHTADAAPSLAISLAYQVIKLKKNNYLLNYENSILF
ncbi:hypothetical protein HNP12_003702 [Aeromonas hydrophila]|uniref:hypothetical protein n=1 Tax=Aeromonas hydrophila TaxID=644 RepID=UPI0021695C29|nr:hypothetical protein [Aeromonas hydrophila]MCS3769581.1 hypothetical protein [Aeromonas hydrophila]